MNESKIQGPLVVIDPTYKFRNVCAGLGEETFQKFLKEGKRFLKTPSLSYFKRKAINVDNLRKVASKKGARFVEIGLKTDRQEGDIAGTKMKKFFNFLVRQIERKKQGVLKREFVYSGEGKEAVGYFVILEKGEIEVGGLDVIMKDAVAGFKRVRKRTYVRNHKVYAKEKVSLKEIFNSARRVGEEMGVSFELVD